MLAAIDEIIAAGSEYSNQVSGSELAQPGTKSKSTLMSAQVVPSSGGDFEIEIQGAVNSVHGPVFTKIGTIDQDSDSFMTTFPVSMNSLFRFKHNSGIACRVLMTG